MNWYRGHGGQWAFDNLALRRLLELVFPVIRSESANQVDAGSAPRGSRLKCRLGRPAYQPRPVASSPAPVGPASP